MCVYSVHETVWWLPLTLVCGGPTFYLTTDMLAVSSRSLVARDSAQRLLIPRSIARRTRAGNETRAIFDVAPSAARE
jgi:hypothetical protein